MATKEQAIQKAIDTLVELCDAEPQDGERDHSRYERKSCAEEILRHYREFDFFNSLITDGLKINGAVPVRPMTRTEVSA